MDVARYFRIAAVSGHVLHLEMKGFWSDEVVEQIQSDVMLQFNEAAAEVLQEGPYIVLADLSHLEVLSQKGRAFLSNAMKHAKEHGMYKAVEVVPNAITRLSTREAAETSGKDDFRTLTKSLDEAAPIVDELARQLRTSRSELSKEPTTVNE